MKWNYKGRKKITKKEIAKEILELSKKIMEKMRTDKPENITIDTTCKDLELLIINNKDFQVIIFKSNDPYSPENSPDYSCAFRFWHNRREIKTIHIKYYENSICITIRNIYGEIVKACVRSELITIHKGIVEIAKKEGLDIDPKISY